MLQRHPAGALGHQIVEPVGNRRAQDHQLAHLAGGRLQDTRRQRQGVELRTLDTGIHQDPDGGANRVPQRRRHSP